MPWSLERAADWLVSHADDVDAAVAVAQAAATPGSSPAAGGQVSSQLCTALLLFRLTDATYQWMDEVCTGAVYIS